MNITHGTWIAIADGARALIMRNDGEADIPNFVVLDVLKNRNNARTSEIGTDKPGRSHSSTTSARSSVGQTDWHELGEQRFAHDFAKILEEHCEAGDFESLVVVAPPRTLAEIRHNYSKRVKDALIAEVDKDLTNHPVYEIERILVEKS